MVTLADRSYFVDCCSAFTSHQVLRKLASTVFRPSLEHGEADQCHGRIRDSFTRLIFLHPHHPSPILAYGPVLTIAIPRTVAVRFPWCGLPRSLRRPICPKPFSQSKCTGHRDEIGSTTAFTRSTAQCTAGQSVVQNSDSS